MERKNLIIIVITIVLILICIYSFMNKNKVVDDIEVSQQTEMQVKYSEMTDEETGETYYQVYNEKSGEVIANVAEEWQTDIYIDNPGYVGTPEVENDGNLIYENTIIE